MAAADACKRTMHLAQAFAPAKAATSHMLPLYRSLHPH